jgi:hypothetical protein
MKEFELYPQAGLGLEMSWGLTGSIIPLSWKYGED